MRTAKENLWLDTTYEPGMPIMGDQETDVCIVGGGITGIAASYFIKQRFPSKRVIVLESEYVGFGSSGRNLGLGSCLLGHNVLPILKSKGVENTRRFHQLSKESISLLDELVKEHNIDCDYKVTGRLDIIQNEKELRLTEDKAKVYEKIGAEFTWLDKSEALSRFQGTKLIAALFSPDDRTFDPARLVRGLKGVAESIGVEVYEHSRCDHIEQGPMITLSTPLAQIRATDIVLGTNAYANPIGLFRNKILPFYVYNIATEPLSDSQVDALGWANREPVKNQKYLFWTLRITDDNRVVLNDANAFYFYNANRDYSYYPKAYKIQHKTLADACPALKGAKATHIWGGRVGMTLDFLPSVGCRGKHRNIFYSMGYNGHGVAFACLAGKMITEMMADERTSLTDHPLVNKSIFGVPSQAVTYLASNGYKQYFGLYDRWLGMGK